jgi:hypothetical protein
MLISHSKKFVFVHVPKTAGDSISEALAEFAEVNGSKNKTKHWPARTIREEHFLDSDAAWGDCFSFGVIRNPWEQVHSDYWFCRQHAVPADESGGWRDKVIRCKQITFAEFVVDICGKHGRSGPGLFDHYLADRTGRKMVFQVLRFERLAEEWPELCARLDLPQIELPRSNITPNRPDYRDDYDERSKFLVARKFAGDIDRFNYHF